MDIPGGPPHGDLELLQRVVEVVVPVRGPHDTVENASPEAALRADRKVVIACSGVVVNSALQCGAVGVACYVEAALAAMLREYVVEALKEDAVVELVALSAAQGPREVKHVA